MTDAATTVPQTPTSASAQLASLYRNRSYTLLWIGQVFSETGSSATALAYPLLILALTGSPLYAGLTGSVSLFSRTAMRLPAGALADRWDRKVTMLACDAVRALVLLVVVAGLLLHRLPWPAVMVVVFIEGSASVLFEPAEQAAVRNVVPVSQLTTAVAANQARSSSAGLVGSPLGGLLFGLAQIAPFAADGFSYLISFCTIASIRQPLREERTAERRRLLPDIAEGIRFIARDPFLRALAMIEPLINAAFTGALFCIIVVLRRHGWSGGVIGSVLAVVSVAGVIGAVVTPWLRRWVSPSHLVIGVSWCLAAALALAAFFINSPIVVVFVAIPMLLAPSVNASLIAHQIAITPDALQGRVVSVILLMASILELPAPAVVGALLEHTSGTVVILVFSCLVILSAIIASIHPGIHLMHSLEESHDKPAAEKPAVS